MAQYDILLTQNTNAAGTTFDEKYVNLSKGGLISVNSSRVPVARAVGTDGYFLKADSADASGLSWAVGIPVALTDAILDGSSNQYAPYTDATAAGAAGRFYLGTSFVTAADLRLNYTGGFYVNSTVYAIYGITNGSNQYGVYGESTGIDGCGVRGVSTSGYGVYGSGTSVGVYGTGGTQGVYGAGATYAVYGNGVGSSAGYGVYGKTNDGSGWGVYGLQVSGVGTTGKSFSGVGVYAISTLNNALTVSKTAAITAPDTTDTMYIERVTSNSSFNQSGNLISILDNPTTGAGVISGSIFKATIVATVRMDMNPRVVNSGTNVAYIFDTLNSLTGTTLLFSLRNSGVEKFSVADDGELTLGVDLSVANGGTGRSTSTTAYALIAAGTTATGAHQTLATGTQYQILFAGTASALPTWSPYTMPSTVAINTMWYASSTSAISGIAAAGTTGMFLMGTSGGAPAWSTLVLPNAAGINTLLYASSANTIAALTVSTTVGTFLRNTTAAGIPAWSTLILPNAITSGYIPYATSTNTIGSGAGLTYSGTVFGITGDITFDSTSAREISVSTSAGANKHFYVGAGDCSTAATAAGSLSLFPGAGSADDYDGFIYLGYNLGSSTYVGRGILAYTNKAVTYDAARTTDAIHAMAFSHDPLSFGAGDCTSILMQAFGATGATFRNKAILNLIATTTNTYNPAFTIQLNSASFTYVETFRLELNHLTFLGYSTIDTVFTIDTVGTSTGTDSYMEFRQAGSVYGSIGAVYNSGLEVRVNYGAITNTHIVINSSGLVGIAAAPVTGYALAVTGKIYTTTDAFLDAGVYKAPKIYKAIAEDNTVIASSVTESAAFFTWSVADATNDARAGKRIARLTLNCTYSASSAGTVTLRLKIGGTTFMTVVSTSSVDIQFRVVFELGPVSATNWAGAYSYQDSTNATKYGRVATVAAGGADITVTAQSSQSTCTFKTITRTMEIIDDPS